MNEITTLAIDLAKNVFELHGVDARGACVLRRRVRRAQLLAVLNQIPPCTVAMEACGGAHHFGRQAQALGHRVRLIAPQFVKPFVKGNKTDRNDAEAICEAAQRPGMRYVALKSVEQQQVLSLHRLRSAAVKMRTALANQLRGLLAEFGVTVPQGLSSLRRALPVLLEDEGNAVPALLRAQLREQRERLIELDAQVRRFTQLIEQQVRANERALSLMQRRGVGPLLASAFAAELPDPHLFKNGRQVGAWLGLVPRQHSSGGKPLLLGISKRGNAYLRTLLIHGARAAMRTAQRHQDAASCWARAVKERRGLNKATVALANKMARQLWAQLAYPAA
jgi:transposase